MELDFKNCSIDELASNTSYIINSNEKKYILRDLLKRNDRKDVISILFKYFLINTDKDVLDIISREEYNDVFDDLIKQNFNSIIIASINSNNVDVLTKFTNRYFNLLLDNFNLLIEHEKFSKHLKTFLKSIYEEKILDRYKDEILDSVLKHLKKDSSKTVLFDYLVMDFFIFLDKMSDDYIEKNIDKFIEAINGFMEKIVVDRLEPTENESAFILNTITKKARSNNMINNLLESKKDFIISLFTGLPKEELKKIELYDFYLNLIDDLLRLENKKLKDLEYHNGGFSNVIIIGDKVLKTGEKNTYEIPYNKRFLQPLIRQYVKSERKCRGGYYENHECIEVYERVSTKNITDDDAYFVFKELLDEGILWADAAPRNLGKLLKPNKVYLNEAYDLKNGIKEEYYVDDEVVGIIRKENKEILQEGELVITDIDEIYDISDLDLIKKIIDEDNLDKYEIDRLIRKIYQIDPANDYLKYIETYIKEEKENINGKKM